MAVERVVEVGGSDGWEEDAPQFFCCCNSVHVRNGAWAVAVIELLTVLFPTTFLIFGLSQHNQGGTPLSVSLALLIAALSIAVLFIHGLRQHRAAFLLPYLILQSVRIIALALGSFACVLAVSLGSTFFLHAIADALHSSLQQAKELIGGIGAGLACALLLGMALQIWSLVVILRTHRYFTEKAAFGYNFHFHYHYLHSLSCCS